MLKKNSTPTNLLINQGDCVKLIDNKSLFQVIGIDIIHEKCWVREWPLLKNGAPVFEISLTQIEMQST